MTTRRFRPGTGGWRPAGHVEPRGFAGLSRVSFLLGWLFVRALDVPRGDFFVGTGKRFVDGPVLLSRSRAGKRPIG